VHDGNAYGVEVHSTVFHSAKHKATAKHSDQSPTGSYRDHVGSAIRHVHESPLLLRIKSGLDSQITGRQGTEASLRLGNGI